MSYCESCDMLVETEWNRYEVWTDKLEYWYGDEGFEGEYELHEVGDVREKEDGTTYQIRVRIDFCANCGTFVRGRTFGAIR